MVFRGQIEFEAQWCLIENVFWSSPFTSNRRMNVWSSSYSRSVWHRVDAACLVHALEASTVRLLSLHWCLTNENSMTCSRPPEPRGMTQISRSASCSEWMIHSRSCDTTAKATRRLNASWCKGRASRGGVCVWKQFPISRTCQYILKHLWLHYKPVFTHQITLQHTNVSMHVVDGKRSNTVEHKTV